MRVRWLGVKGRLSSGISDSDVTITSDGLADLPEVVSPDYTVLVLDPDGLSGRPEVVYVTDHAASATSATITRGEETGDGGSVARAHEAGVAWYHAATPQDYEGMLFVADEAERESSSVQSGSVVWQEDTGEHWTYVGGATPVWRRNNTYHQFIYNSSGVQVGNRFNNWADLQESLTTEEGPRIILFEQDETIPAGAWNFDNVELRGNNVEYTQGGFTVTFGDNTTISSWMNAKITGLRVLSTSTTGPIWSPSGALVFSMATVSHVHSTNYPFISHSGSGQVVLLLNDSARFLKLSGGVENFETSGPAFGVTLVVGRGQSSIVGNDTLASTNAVVFVDIVLSSSNDLETNGFPSTHTNLNVGVAVPIRSAYSYAVGFTATGLAVVTADNAQDAIEELDAAVDAVTTDVAALPTIASGTYTPTATPGTTNTDDVIPGLAFWTRIGDVVTVSGVVAVDHTTSGAATAVSLDLPVPSDLADFSDLAGTIACEDAAGSALGEDTGDLVLFQFTAPSTATRSYGYNYSYRVL